MTVIRSNAKQLTNRIQARLKKLEPKSEQTKRSLHLIGTMLRNRMVMEATRKRIVDTGALRNSINYRIDGNSVTVGSFGVPYARFHEFGAVLHPGAVRAMFAAMKKRSGPRRSKGVMVFNKNGSATLRARPFVRPALDLERARILAILKGSYSG